MTFDIEIMAPGDIKIQEIEDFRLKVAMETKPVFQYVYFSMYIYFNLRRFNWHAVQFNRWIHSAYEWNQQLSNFTSTIKAMRKMLTESFTLDLGPFGTL